MTTKNCLNKMIFGRSEIQIPKHLDQNSINLIYTDPPFNSRKDYYHSSGEKQATLRQKKAYSDMWSEGKISYIKYMEKIFSEIYDVMIDGGILIVHCDDSANIELGYMLTQMFEEDGGKRMEQITWQRRPYAKNNAENIHFRNADFLQVYRKGEGKSVFNKQFFTRTKEELNTNFQYVEEETRRRFSSRTLEIRDVKTAGTTLMFGDKTYTTKIGWKWTQETLNKRLEQNPHLIYWTKKGGGKPRYKIYMDEDKGIPISNIWTDINGLTAGSEERKKMGFDTQKPESLLERIILTYSNKGDIVLDPFLGSGTTGVVCKKLNRKFIGIENNKLTSYKAGARIFGNKKHHENIIDYYLSVIELDKMEGYEFQKYVMEQMGAKMNEKKSGDGGIDGTFPNGEIVQTKNSNVGRPVVQQIAGIIGSQTNTAIIVGKQFSNEAAVERNKQKEEKGYRIIFITSQEIHNGDYTNILRENNIETVYDIYSVEPSKRKMKNEKMRALF